MEKPNYAPNFIGDLMSNCWEKGPEDRPTFSQIEEIIDSNLEASVSSYYSNLNAQKKSSHGETSLNLPLHHIK